jgi:Spy/CpxP family protein refolding chaperone
MQKRSKTLWVVACLGVVALAAVTTVALAQGGPERDGDKGGQHERGFRPGPAHPMLERMLGPKLGHLSCRLLQDPEVVKNLNLTADQQDKIRKIDEATEEKDIDQEAALKKANLQLRRLMEAEKPDRAKIMDQVDKVNALEGERQKLDIARRLDLREALTAEQLTKAMEMRAEFRKEMRDRFDDVKGMFDKGDRPERRFQCPMGLKDRPGAEAAKPDAQKPDQQEPGEGQQGEN